MSTQRRSQGFTIIELVIVLAIMGMLVLIGLPALLNSLSRANLVNAAKESAMVMRQARFEAVKQSVVVAVVADQTNKRVYSFTDSNNNCIMDGTETQLATFSMPKSIDMTNPTNAQDFIGFDTDGAGNGCAHFLSTGAADKAGSFRFHGKDGYFEARVDPTATGKVSVRKYSGNGSSDNVDTDWWRNGETDGGGTTHYWWS